MKKTVTAVIFLLVILMPELIFSNWEKEIPLSSNKYFSQYPYAFESDKYTFVVWTSMINNKPNIFYSCYDRGQWQKPELVCSLNKNKITIPGCCYFQGKLYVFLNNDDNTLQIFYKNFPSAEPFKSLVPDPQEKFSLLPVPRIIDDQVFLFYQKFINDEEIKIRYYPGLDLNQKSFTARDLIQGALKEYGNFFPEFSWNNDRLYTVWTSRFGEKNYRHDIIFLKTSTDNGESWSQDTALSQKEEDAKFPSFLIRNNRIYLSYTVNELVNNQFNNYLMTKIYDAQNYSLLETQKLNFNFYSYYNVRLTWFNGRFYLLWYTAEKGKTDIYYTWSEDFKIWETPQPINNSPLNNSKFIIVDRKKLAVIFEQRSRNSSVICYQEKDMYCAPPVVYSPTHKTNQWSYESSVILKWTEAKDPSGIKGYCYLFDDRPDSIPDIENLSGSFNGKSFENVKNGISWFHLRAVDQADNYSDTVHYKIRVNTNPPDMPKIICSTHAEFIPSDNTAPHFSWTLPDDRPIKGFSYIFTQDKDQTPVNQIKTKNKEVQFKNVKEGVWYFRLKTCDLKNRWSDYASYTILIEKILIASKVPENVQSRYSYIVRKGEVLSRIITRVLKTRNSMEWREFERPVGQFNYIQNLDFLNPGDIIMFPIIIAQPSDTLETISRNIYGDSDKTDKLVIVDKKQKDLEAGDKIILKDTYFLKTGEIPVKKKQN